ncbi:MAG: hypothetical protein AAGI54_07730 [Planctomycetota bacterium]
MDKHQKRKELIEDVDLDRNDLEAALANAGQLWDKFGTKSAIVILALALGFMSWRLYSSWTTSTQENSLTDLAVETTPAGFERIAQAYGDPAVKTRALLAGGDTALGEAVRLDPQAEQETWEQTLAEAERLYTQAAELAPADVYAVNARLGLASVAESRERWDDARAQYEMAIELAEPTLGFLADVARERAAMLDSLREPIALAPDAPAEAPEPALDITLPGLDLPSLDAALPDDGESPSDGLNFDAMLDDAAGGISLPGLEGLDPDTDADEEPQP